jgi:hypothetical protein
MMPQMNAYVYEMLISNSIVGSTIPLSSIKVRTKPLSEARVDIHPLIH